MAYLNVRDRRMETKIAYIGAKLAGKATNLRHLTSDSARGRSTDLQIDDDTLSLEWRPLRVDRFDGCDVAVKLVAAKGAASTERLAQLLDNADGIVVVVDSAPSARNENTRVLELVREALSKQSARSIPVVVQVNKVDLPDAVPAHELAGTVDWPIVPAAAARGEGVIETLEMALDKVLETMKTKEAPITAKLDQNPLLSALRAVLRETVAEHVTAFEARAAEGIVASMTATFERSEGLISELRTMIAVNAQETARALASQEAALSALASAVADLQAISSALAARVDDLTTSERNLEAELAERSRSDREHATALASVMKRNLHALENDLKKLDAREHHARVTAELSKLESKVEALTSSVVPAASSIAGFPARLGALESSLQREVRDRVLPQLARLEDSIQVLHVDTGESLQRADARTSDIQGGLNELLEELKKRKKGWFS